MEVCGGQTHTMLKSGLLDLLPEQIETGARAGMPGVRDAARADR